MKYLFIKPICETWDRMPLIGIPSLIGILENAGVESEYINLDSEYNRTLLNFDLRDYFNKIKNFYEHE